MKSKSFNAFLAFLFAIVLLSFQNCSPIRTSTETSPDPQKINNNGGPYSGVQKIYQYFNSVNPCSDKDMKGQPLANSAVLFKVDATMTVQPYLARENCVDLKTPTHIAESDIQVNAADTTKITYKTLSLSAQPPPQDFEVVAAQCPAGKTEIPGAVRTNLVLSPFNWVDTYAATGSGWVNHKGVSVSLYSTMQGLPAYLLERTDPNNLDAWRRASQFIVVKPNTQYAYSALVGAGTVNGADINIYRANVTTPGAQPESLLMTCDFQTMTVKQQWAVNIGAATGTVTRVGSNYLCTVYFTSTSIATTEPMDNGVAATGNGQNMGFLGDSIVATDAQMVEVNQFCR